MIYLDFYPYNKPNYKGIITLPSSKLEIYTRDTSSSYVENYMKITKPREYDIDLEKLKKIKSKDNYTLKEIKTIAGNLGIKGISIMNKKDIIKLILLQLEKDA